MYGTVSAATVAPVRSVTAATTSVMPSWRRSARVRYPSASCAASPSPRLDAAASVPAVSTAPVAVVSSGKRAPTRTWYPKSAGDSTWAMMRTAPIVEHARGCTTGGSRSASSRIGRRGERTRPRSGGCRCARSNSRHRERRTAPMRSSRGSVAAASSVASTRKIWPTLRPTASAISVCDQRLRRGRRGARARRTPCRAPGPSSSGCLGLGQRHRSAPIAAQQPAGDARGRCRRAPAGHPVRSDAASVATRSSERRLQQEAEVHRLERVALRLAPGEVHHAAVRRAGRRRVRPAGRSARSPSSSSVTPVALVRRAPRRRSPTGSARSSRARRRRRPSRTPRRS